jgi:hypothetical protein
MSQRTEIFNVVTAHKTNVFQVLQAPHGAMVFSPVQWLRAPIDSEHLYRLIPSSRSE